MDVNQTSRINAPGELWVSCFRPDASPQGRRGRGGRRLSWCRPINSPKRVRAAQAAPKIVLVAFPSEGSLHFESRYTFGRQPVYDADFEE